MKVDIYRCWLYGIGADFTEKVSMHVPWAIIVYEMRSILQLFQRMDYSLVHACMHAFRKCNMAADFMANLGCKLGRHVVFGGDNVPRKLRGRGFWELMAVVCLASGGIRCNASLFPFLFINNILGVWPFLWLKNKGHLKDTDQPF